MHSVAGGSGIAGLIFYGFHRFWINFMWVGVDFMDSWGPSSDALWQPVAAYGDRVWTLLEVWSDYQRLDDIDDSMI